MLYLHGGGFIGGSIDVADDPCRAVANGTGAIVVSAEYRLAAGGNLAAVTALRTVTRVDRGCACRWRAPSGADFRAMT